jgi:hypothetical protein
VYCFHDRLRLWVGILCGAAHKVCSKLHTSLRKDGSVARPSPIIAPMIAGRRGLGRAGQASGLCHPVSVSGISGAAGAGPGRYAVILVPLPAAVAPTIPIAVPILSWHSQHDTSSDRTPLAR